MMSPAWPPEVIMTKSSYLPGGTKVLSAASASSGRGLARPDRALARAQEQKGGAREGRRRHQQPRGLHAACGKQLAYRRGARGIRVGVLVRRKPGRQSSPGCEKASSDSK